MPDHLAVDFLLDTNHTSPLVTEGHPLQRRVRNEMASGKVFGIAAPCLVEVVYGIGVLPREATNRRNWKLLQKELVVFGIEESDAELAAQLQIDLRRKGWQLETIDAMVAAVALKRDCMLLSTDGDFAAVPDLRVENWLSRP